MEDFSGNTRAGCAAWLFVGMTALAILLTLGSVMSRADNASELVEGHVVDLVVVAPLWAAVIFVKSRCRGGSKARALTLACAIRLARFVAYCLEYLEAQHENRHVEHRPPFQDRSCR